MFNILSKKCLELWHFQDCNCTVVIGSNSGRVQDLKFSFFSRILIILKFNKMKKYLVVHCFTTTFQLSTEHLTFDDEFIICTTNDVIYYVGITSLVRVSRSDSYNLKKKKKTKNLEISFKIKKTENIVYAFLKEEAIYRARF